MQPNQKKPIAMLGDIPIVDATADYICVVIDAREILVPSEIAISDANETGRAYMLTQAYYCDDRTHPAAAIQRRIADRLTEEYMAKNIYLCIE